jgi:hypothetical protein
MIFDLFNGNNDSRDNFGRMEAEDIGKAVELALDYFINPEYRKKVDVEYSAWRDDNTVYLTWFETDDEMLYIEISESDDQETKSFKTIFGEDNFYYVGEDGKLKKDPDAYTTMKNVQMIGNYFYGEKK